MLPHPAERFEDVYAAESAPLRAWMRARTGDDAAAEDLASETFLRALNGWDGYRGEASRRSWLWRIAHNTLANWFRSASRDRSVSVDEPPAVGEAPPIPIEERAAVWELLSLVATPRARTAVYLRYVEGLGTDEVGERLDLSPNAVRSLTHRALRDLRQQLTEIPEVPQ